MAEVLEGSLPVLLPVNERATVGVVTSGTGEWCWAATSLGLTVRWVWSQDVGTLPRWLTADLPEALFTTNKDGELSLFA